MKYRLYIPIYIVGVWVFLISATSCIRVDKYNNSPQGNFDALWQIIDEQYCYLDYKGIDWDAIYTEYNKRITPDMSREGLFEVLGDMLAELKDGHVNLSSAFNVARYWKWYEDYPRNFNETIQEKNYLGTDYRIGSGIKYTILEDNIAYLYYGSFSDAIGEGNLSEILQYVAICNGMIIDVRNNGGGMLTNSTTLAARFVNDKILTGYIMHKTGKGHSDFSDPAPIYLSPSNSIRWQKKVAILTNRHSYSATNDFVNIMKEVGKHTGLVTIIGDQTGGGSGLPFTSELPNGWGVRFSASPQLDAEMNHTEFGIAPDIHVDMEEADELQGLDTIIETARKFLNE